MSLIADICNIPIQLPHSHSASVVLGSAMLGAAASEEAERLGTQGGGLDSQKKAEESSFGMKENLWGNMVRWYLRYLHRPTALTLLHFLVDSYVETWNYDPSFSI
jgi:ribulose kinase